MDNTKAELLHICDDIISRAKTHYQNVYEAMRFIPREPELKLATALKALLTTTPEPQLREALQHIHHIAVVFNRYVEQPPSDMLDIERIADKALSTQPHFPFFEGQTNEETAKQFAPQDREGWQWVPTGEAMEKLASALAGAMGFIYEALPDDKPRIKGWVKEDFRIGVREVLKAAPQPPEPAQHLNDKFILAQALKDIYAIRGEDAEIAEIVNQALRKANVPGH